MTGPLRHSTPPESTRATAAELAPIDSPPTDITPGLDAAVPKASAGRPARSARRAAPSSALSRSAITALAIVVPLALLVIGGTWFWLRRRPPPPPPVVVELPLPPAPPPVAVAPTPPPAPPPEEPKLAPPPKVVPMLAGRPVVLEYADAADPVDVPGTNPAVVAKAREAYRYGNARLAAKDKKGAVKAYRASLKHYPAYLGSYRGLGRALAVSGDKKGALKVLKLYLQTAPEADDAAVIKGLIDRLGKKPPRRGK